MKWKPDLDRVPLLIREVFHIHVIFISITLSIFALLTWRFADEIHANSTSRNRSAIEQIGEATKKGFRGAMVVNSPRMREGEVLTISVVQAHRSAIEVRGIITVKNNGGLGGDPGMALMKVRLHSVGGEDDLIGMP